MTTMTLDVENNALKTVPVHEDHRRGKNWAATLTLDPHAPGGLERAFWRRCHGEYFYDAAGNVGDAVEFGADYYSGRGKKSATRWYGVIVSVSDSEMVLVECRTGAEACRQAAEIVAEYRKSVPANPPAGVDLNALGEAMLG